MKIESWFLAAAFMAGLSLASVAQADEFARYDASLASSPLEQGWEDFSTAGGGGQLVDDLGEPAWRADGVGGRPQWRIVPDVSLHHDAAVNGWRLGWRSRGRAGDRRHRPS